MGSRELHRLSAPLLCRSTSLHGTAHSALVHLATRAVRGDGDDVLYPRSAAPQGLPALGDIPRSDHRLRHGWVADLEDPASDPHHPGRPLLLPIARSQLVAFRVHVIR